MPLVLNDDAPTTFPKPNYLTLDNWRRGVITILDRSRIPTNALAEADNLILVEDGQPSIRPGVDWYGAELPNSAAIDGFDYFDYAGAIHLVAVGGGVVYRSTDDGVTWTACTGATPTAGVAMNMLQNGSYLYLTNGTDNMIRYDGSTTLAVYTSLATPSAPTVAETGLTGTGNNYYYKTCAVNTVGNSIASSASTVVQTSVARDTWDSTTNYATITVPAFVATQTRADIYISENDVDYYYIASTTVSGETYKDDGTAIPNPATTAPTANTSTGIKAAALSNVGSRMYGVRDPDNPYRIWFSGPAPYSGAFASAYDGGYLNWQTGGKYRPVHVEDYRDGKGTPLATVWCDSADGQGCILQMSLDTMTIADVSITVPSAYKLPGSRGTPAPGSVANVLNDYYFYNSQAIYNLGSRAQFLNLLSTDEASGNIRNTVKRISQASESMIASVYFDAKVLFSVGYGSSTPNATAVYDTERKAWLPKAFSLGFKKFLKYTDTGGTYRLLALKPGDNRLSEISSSIKGDYGVAFSTSLLTGLYPTTKNRFDFQFTEEAEFELTNHQGTVDIGLIGIERTRGFGTTKSTSLTSSITNTGWDSYNLWDSYVLWDDTSDIVDTYSESSKKKYFTVQKELNAVQWSLTTNTLDAFYVLRTLQTWGRPTLAGKPRDWRLV